MLSSDSFIACLRDQTWLCVYCWCPTPEGVVSPVRRQHPREFDTNNTHTIMFDPDYNMMPPFFSSATNILLIKSNLKFELRATAVSVAMTPRYPGVKKYRGRLHPRSQKCACQVLRETERVKLNCARPASSASRGDNEVEFQMHTVQWKWQVLHTYGISVVKQVGMFFDGIACLMNVWPLFKREFPLVPKTWRSAHARISNVTTSHLKQIDPHWFQGRQMRLWWMVSTISWE